MATVAAQVHRAIQAAGIAVTGVSIGRVADKATWRVTPSALQAAAQATIQAFVVGDPAVDLADLDAQATAVMDGERLASAIIWCVIDTYSAPATRAKYLSARQKVIDAYKAQPWKP